MASPRGFDLAGAQVRDTPGDDPVPVCEGPKAIYGLRSRQTIRRLLADWLAQYKITPTELLHLPEHLARLENAGSLLQGAVQWAARAQVKGTKGDVQQRMRVLYALFDEILKQVRSDARSGRMPVLQNDDLAALARRVGEDPDPTYCFNAALSQHVAGEDSLSDKLRVLLGLLDNAPDGAVPLLDQLIADFLDDAGALTDLLGEQPDLMAALRCLVALVEGETGGRPDVPRGRDRLCRWIGAGWMPRCRDTVLRRIAQTLWGHRPLAEGDLMNEARAQASLIEGLRDAEGRLRGGLAMTEAFRARARRQLHPEAIGGLLKDAQGALAQFERLLEIEDGIIEGPSKELLGDYIQAIVASRANRADFTEVPANDARQRMRRLAELERRVAASGLAEVRRETLRAALDDFWYEVLTGSRLLERLAKGADDPTERAVRLLSFCAEAGVTQGRALGQVRAKALGVVRAPGFMEALSTRAAADADGRDRLIALRRLLRSVEATGHAF